MNHSDFYDAFDFDDDTPMLALQVATEVVVGAGAINQRRRTESRDSISRCNIVNRNRKEGELRLYNDYFAENPKFTESQFRRRFRMSRHLFLRIANAVEAHNPYFKQKKDAIGVLGLSCLQKVIVAHEILAYGIKESIAITSLRAFVKSVVKVFGD